MLCATPADPVTAPVDGDPLAPLATICAVVSPTWTFGQFTSVRPVLETAPSTSALLLFGSTTTQTLLTFSEPVLPFPASGFTCVAAASKPAPHAAANGATVSSTAAVARPARPRREGVDRRVVLEEWRLLTVGLAPWRVTGRTVLVAHC